MLYFTEFAKNIGNVLGFRRKSKQLPVNVTMYKFRSLNCFSDDFKNAVAPIIERYSLEMIKNDTLFNRYLVILGIIITSFWLIVISRSIFVLYNLIVSYILSKNILYQVQNWEKLVVILFFALIISAFLFYFIIRFLRTFYVPISISVFLLIMLEIFIFSTDWTKEEHYIINGIASIFLFDIFFLFFMTIMVQSMFLCIDFLEIRINHRHPVARLSKILIDVLAAAENTASRHRLTYRQEQISKLEEVANCFEYYFIHFIRGKDAITNIRMKEIAYRIGAAIREKKMWILTPKSDTNSYFIKSISYILVCIVNDNWDALEQIDRTHLTASQVQKSVLNSIVIIVRACLVAGLPMLGVWFFQQTPFAFNGAILNFVVIGLFLWLLLNFTILIDPNINNKISAFRDVTGVFYPQKPG